MSSPLENLVIRELQLLLPPAPTLVLACSGGMDSMCLAHLLHSTNLPLVIAHVNYGLRGADSDGDADFVMQWAKERKLPFYPKTVSPESLCEPGESVQMAARRWRYQWLEEIRASLPNAVIVTAHHLDDAIETFLQNIMRGTGLKGLTGITNRLPTTIRPFKQFPRSLLLDYAIENQIHWREDASNQTPKYDRNCLRLEVLPALEHRFPGYREGFRKTMLHAEESALLQHWSVQHWQELAWSKHQHGASIQPSVFHHLPFAKLLLVEWLYPFGFHPDQCSQMLEAGFDTTFTAGDWILYKGTATWELRKTNAISKDKLIFPVKEGQYPTPEGPMLQIAFLDQPEDAHFKDPNCCLIDIDWLSGSEHLTLRHWEEGDRIQPIGMHGKHQKIHDVLTNAKVPQYEKQRRVLEIKGHIVWIPGLKRSIHGLLHPSKAKAALLTWIQP